MDIGKWLTDNKSGILSGIACVGVLATAVLTGLGVIGAQKTIKEWTEEKHDELTTFEKFQASVKPLLPAAGAAIATIVCIKEAHKIDTKHIAALASGAAITAKKYDEYRKTNKRVNGDEADKAVQKEIMVEKAKDANICAPSFFTLTDLNSRMSKEEMLFYDTITEQYFTASLAHVIEAEDQLNRNFTMGADTDVDMWCGFLGIPNKNHDTRGWCVNDCFTWLDFNNGDPVDLGDGMKAIPIECAFEPIPGYLDFDPIEDDWPCNELIYG